MVRASQLLRAARHQPPWPRASQVEQSTTDEHVKSPVTAFEETAHQKEPMHADQQNARVLAHKRVCTWHCSTQAASHAHPKHTASLCRMPLQPAAYTTCCHSRKHTGKKKSFHQAALCQGQHAYCNAAAATSHAQLLTKDAHMYINRHCTACIRCP